MALNAITLDVTGQVVEWGDAPQRAPVAGETAHVDSINVSSQPIILDPDNLPRFTKVVGSDFVAMNAAEREVVSVGVVSTLGASGLDSVGILVVGMWLENDGVTPDSIINISAGLCASSLPDILMRLLTGASVDLAAAAGAGAIDVGTVAADSWYAIHVIGDRKGINTESAIGSLSGDDPTLPSGYDRFRRVGWVRTDASADVLIFDMPKEPLPSRWVFWKERIEIQVAGTANTFSNTETLSAATRVPATARMQQVDLLVSKLGGASEDAAASVIPDGWNEAAGPPALAEWAVNVGFTGNQDGTARGIFDMPVGPAQLVRYRVENGDAEATIAIRGWKDAL